ncbi:putative Ig domain-containing protein [Microcoleus sp. FACHB-1515]|uniref:putative Ig domain-containing protein n=1 Tax=Cyanophyceae TaxID=3028117 RepID=UPI0016887294|nr:putative Ig domain-containing protein [Microcoleus sp. FACHB-1515]MBD2089905.1 putative Ig domain-containing protein [Microcoleus sp. FACHB-1515]
MTSFGATGKITTDFGGNDESRDVIALSDGKILVGGFIGRRTTGNDFAIARYNADGTLDASFGIGGSVTTDIRNNSNDVGFGMAVQSDGKILLTGFTSPSSPADDFVVVRYNPDGTLDTSFGTGGIVITETNGGFAHRVAVQSDGKIVVAGHAGGTASSDFAVFRYNIDGSLDTSFGTGGKVVTDPGDDNTFNIAYGLAIQNNGKILVTGYAGNRWDVAIVRYNEDGTLDTSFGTGGKVITDINNSTDLPYSLTVQSNGKILVAGYSVSNNYNFALVRYNEDGTLDTSFGTGGKLVDDSFNSSYGSGDPPISIKVQSDGKILVAGHKAGVYGVSTTDFAVVRYNEDGTLDTSFGTGGIVTTDINNTPDISYGMTVQIDGKILVVGNTSDRFRNNFAIVRYNPDGSLDANFLPTSADAIVSTIANTPYTFAASDFPFSDANGETLRSIYITGLETAGSLFFDSDGNGQEDDGEAVRIDRIIPVDDLNKLKFTPDANVDRASFQFRVRDAYGFSTADYTMSIDLDEPPSISGTPATTIDEDGIYSFTPTAIDPERTSLIFTIQNQPTWATFDTATGTLSGTPTNAAVGTTSGIVISVSDGVNSIALPAFDLTVTNTNDAPTVANAIADQTAQAGRAFRFSLPSQTFQDIDAQDRLTLSVTQADGTALPSWLSFNPATGEFTGTPPQAGSLSLKVTATDRANASIRDEFVLSIAPAPLTNPDPTPTNPLSGQLGEWPISFGRITNRKNGTSKADRLIGTNGNDGLNGRRGDDLINGRAGDDILDGGRGDDRLAGGAGNDRLAGGAGSDLLIGGAGNDRLIGGLGFGRDTLIGGAGSDMFVLTGTGRSHTIVDFEAGDRIHLASIFASSSFREATLDQVIRVNQVGANTEIQFDIDGLGSGSTYKTIASLQNFTAANLSASNFVIR